MSSLTVINNQEAVQLLMHSFHRQHPFLSVKHDVYIFTFSTEEKIPQLYVAFFVKFRVKLHLVNFFRLKTLENLPFPRGVSGA